VIAVKILEYGIVPPVPNYKEVDPDLGVLNLSRGGRYPVQYALHLAAGFGSQIAMTLARRIPGGLDRVDNKLRYQRWLADERGHDRVETEVVKRVLRVRADAVPVRAVVPSAWQYGTGPTVRAAAPGDISAAAYRPAPMAAVAQALRVGQASGVSAQEPVRMSPTPPVAVPIASTLPPAPMPALTKAGRAPASAVAPKRAGPFAGPGAGAGPSP
jgi:hypothetical protein